VRTEGHNRQHWKMSKCYCTRNIIIRSRESRRSRKVMLTAQIFEQIRSSVPLLISLVSDPGFISAYQRNAHHGCIVGVMPLMNLDGI